jgi:O-antigen/teichoic acid export membrane protein
MKESILKIGYVSILNFINLGLGLILFLSLAQKLSIEDFGIYALLTLLLVSLSKIIDFGSNSTFVSDFISKGKHSLNEVISFKIISFVMVSLISLIILIYVNNITNISLLISFILGLFFYGINYSLFGLFQKDEEFFKASMLNFFPALVKAIFGGLFVTGFIQPDYILGFQVFALSMAASAIFLKFKIKEIKTFKFTFSIKTFFKKFYLAGVSQAINESWSTISNQILALLRTLVDLGSFSLASKLSNVFSLISYSIYTVILTTNAKRRKFLISYNLTESLILGIFLIIIATIGSFIAPIFFKVFFGNKFDDSIIIFTILLFSQAFASIHKFLDNFFFIEEKSQTLLKFTIIKLLLFIILSVLLTNTYGIIGLAVADLVVSLTITIFTFVYILNFRKTHFNIK